MNNMPSHPFTFMLIEGKQNYISMLRVYKRKHEVCVKTMKLLVSYYSILIKYIFIFSFSLDIDSFQNSTCIGDFFTNTRELCRRGPILRDRESMIYVPCLEYFIVATIRKNSSRTILNTDKTWNNFIKE